MHAVSIFEKSYGGIGYYKGHIRRLKEFYAAKNHPAFQQEMGELLVSIDWD